MARWKTLGLPLLLAGALVCLAVWVRPARAADVLDSDPEYFAAAASFSNGFYDTATGQLLGLLKRYPRHPRLQMLLADAYEHSGDPQTASKLFAAALANKPDTRAEAVATEALARLRQRVEQEPAGPAKLAALFDLTAQQVAAMSVTYPEAATRRTEHFDITAYNAPLADVLAQRVEAIFDRVRRTVLGDRLFSHRVELIVYPNQAAFAKAQPAPHWSGGGFLFTPQPDGAVRRAVLLYQVDEQNRFRATLLSRELPHELAHVVLREFFGQSACPTWLDEGLACAAEADGGRAMADRMRELLTRQSAVPLAEMIDQLKPPMDRPVSFYAQAASWTRFLRSSLSDAQMKTFLGHIKDGQKPSVALGRTLFLDNRPGWLGATEERWHKSVLDKAE